jgi:DNA segregation ATPase FtsK/SpoIIIE-like protein
MIKIDNNIIDLNTNPHFLIGGTSGSGKTYFIINKLINALNDFDIVIIDSKKDINIRAKNVKVYAQEKSRSVLNNFLEIMFHRQNIFN